MRDRWLRAAIRVEILSVVWIVTEASLGSLAAMRAGSLAISAFSLDSAVELVAGCVLLARLLIEWWSGRDGLSKAAERSASAVVACCLFLLAGMISFKSGQALAVRTATAVSPLGLTVAAASSVITPWLARKKRQLGVLLHSHALLGDAACSVTCAYMAWTLLAGLLLQWAVNWWWIDALAALGILYFVLREAWESAVSAVRGEGHVHGHAQTHTAQLPH
ncbi:MAG: hypothetical protein K6T83_08860 [Alicyclobacillus sp.]|nr:hypothetical protein [Alicyclobacillus sp.]